MDSSKDIPSKPSPKETEWLLKLMEGGHIPALSISVISEGKLSWSTTLGYADLESKTKADDDSIFWACSLSKPLFAYLVVKLIQEKKLGKGLDGKDFNLNTPLGETGTANDIRFEDNEKMKTLTAGMILSHQSSLENEVNNEPGSLKFASTPGEEFRYSGEGYYHLQKFIENRTGLSLQDLADREIFTPLNLKHTSFSLPAANTLVENHDTNMQHQNRLPKIRANHENAAGSLHTNAKEYALIIIDMLNNKEFMELVSTPLVSTVKDKKAIEKDVPMATLKSIDWTIGLGLQSSDFDNKNLIAFHWGHGPGARGFVAIDVNTRSAVVYFANSDNGLSIAPEVTEKTIGNIQPITDYLFKKYGYEEYNSPSFIEKHNAQKIEMKKDYKPEQRLKWLHELSQAMAHPMELKKETLQAYAGEYEPASITLNKNNSLELVLFGEQKHELVPINETTFASKQDLTFRLEFDKTKQTLTTHFLYNPNQPYVKTKQVPIIEEKPHSTIIIQKKLGSIVNPLENTERVQEKINNEKQLEEKNTELAKDEKTKVTTKDESDDDKKTKSHRY